MSDAPAMACKHATLNCGAAFGHPDLDTRQQTVQPPSDLPLHLQRPDEVSEVVNVNRLDDTSRKVSHEID